MGKYLNKNSVSGKYEECVQHSFDSDPITSLPNSSVHDLRREGSLQALNKPKFSKIPQVKCNDIMEADEQDSSCSSNWDNVDSLLDNKYFKTPVSGLIRSELSSKSPDFTKRSAAESKVRGTILT
jgi:hypothetical protein